MLKLYKGINGLALKSNRPLNRAELLEVVPSIFAIEGHSSRSSRFAPVATIDVLDRLAQENYFPMFAIQSQTRDASKRDYTKHMIRLRQPGKQEGEANEIILVNANDGTSAYQLMAGQFRFVCSNGLVMGDMSHNTKIYHKGTDIMDDVIEGVYTVVKDFDEIERYKKEMKQIQLSTEQRDSFAIAAYIMKEGLPENGDWANAVYQPRALLSTKDLNTLDRYDNSLYSTFNTVQQHMMAGGQRGYNPHTGRRRSSREVTNIDKNIDLNSTLWRTAMKMVDQYSLLKNAEPEELIQF
ncbi:hypothetical protein GAP32_039 [Cronobacter phage vB_CsaM_GAP32]|uniref:DUF945 domain-containing protein n=1 Tax=Cronobacter phage vB_CsaM_GAP32 TaxID=1141136 RepID=K4F5L3_9CAUD|nr:hypothetical protein GAP32_039 [Cronobacter phage vB_CsaM_GAP32]AFC21486.1 hypothetical protein GAP32_039 [Cronobacter phage vB_CsaM_GAP32]